MNLEPLRDNVLVRRSDPESKSRGGILIPEVGREKPRQGDVLAVGPGKADKDGNLVPMSVAVGQRVLFGHYAGNEVTILGEQYLVISQDDILAIIKE